MVMHEKNLSSQKAEMNFLKGRAPRLSENAGKREEVSVLGQCHDSNRGLRLSMLTWMHWVSATIPFIHSKRQERKGIYMYVCINISYTKKESVNADGTTGHGTGTEEQDGKTEARSHTHKDGETPATRKGDGLNNGGRNE
ncbi:hypothetical protein M514_23208 [Trichuris suis]|uniref:Uncharacterized protein n=1 Tax=Trichuris suis TaxID=68888 RepID=A0A085N560_9BILA|nr:hypothetical protein M514_23208 [Trichuris suis]